MQDYVFLDQCGDGWYYEEWCDCEQVCDVLFVEFVVEQYGYQYVVDYGDCEYCVDQYECVLDCWQE